MEKWKKIKGYEGVYEVSSEGRVRSMQRELPRIMRLETHIKGYKRIMLSYKNSTERFFVHRLVADAFIPNPDCLPIVNHKDRNKENNAVSNLEWVTASENTVHWQEDKKMKAMQPAVEFEFAASDLPW